MTKAIVVILQQRNTGQNVTIIANVTINGVTKKEKFSVSNELNNAEMEKQIGDKIKEDSKIDNKVGRLSNFEVEL